MVVILKLFIFAACLNCERGTKVRKKSDKCKKYIIKNKEKQIMKKRIVMDRGDAVKLAASMHCTREMVSKALNFKKDTDLARRIRHVAKSQYGGMEIGSR